ncbi:MAG: TRAP transporter substrate-binding protein DctP [Pseudomonadota bacterium]
MKSLGLKEALLGAVFLGLAGVATAGAAQAEAKTLRVTSQLPPTHPVTSNLMAFSDSVAQTCPAEELEFQIFHSAQLYKDSEVPQAVASGAIDMGTASLTRFAGTIPAVDVFYVPFTFRDPEHVKAVTEPGSAPRALIDDAVLKTGARVLWWQAVGNAILMGNEAWRLPSDAEGKKIRVFGKTLGDFVTAIGASPALISGSEQFLAYQRGTVDGGMSSPAGILSRKLYEVLDYLMVTNHADVEFVVIINEGVWQSLTEAQQACIMQAGAAVEADLRDTIIQKDLDAIEFVRNETEMQVIELTPEERAAWIESAAPVRETYLESAGPLGAKLLEEINKL